MSLSGLAVGRRSRSWLTLITASNRCLTTATTLVMTSETCLFFLHSAQHKSPCQLFLHLFAVLMSLAGTKQLFCHVLSVGLGIRRPKCTLGCSVSAVSGAECDDVISCLTPGRQIDSDKKIPYRPHGQTVFTLPIFNTPRTEIDWLSIADWTAFINGILLITDISVWLH